MRELVKELYWNEVFIDVLLRKRLGLDPVGVNFRPLKYRRLNSSRLCLFLLSFLWPFVLCGLNGYFFIRSMFISSVKVETLAGKEVWVESSLKSERIRRASLLEKMVVVDIRRGDYFSFLSKCERVKLLVDSVRFICFSSSDFSCANKLQLIELYRVLCFFEFILKANSSASALHICNHYDRWAMACYAAFSRGVEVWQHGIIDSNIELPVKLKNISCVHSLSVGESEIWRKYLVDINSDIVLQALPFKLSSGLKRRFLLISHPAHIGEELLLLRAVKEFIGAEGVAYKPHPVYDYSSFMFDLRGMGVEVLGPNVFPDASLVVTKGSTLGREYEGVGVKVFWWSEEGFYDFFVVLKQQLLLLEY